MTSPDSSPGRRLLFVAPFPPRLDAPHGGGRVIAQLLTELGRRHRIALLYLRGADEQDVDDPVRASCDLVEAVSRPRIDLSVMRKLTSALRGHPTRTMEWWVPAFHDRLRHVINTWRPELIQVEFEIMAQYLSSKDVSHRPRVLVVHEAATRAAGASVAQDEQMLERMQHAISSAIWERYERWSATLVDVLVVFTDEDQRALARLAGRTPIVRIPFGTPIPDQPSDSIGADPPSILFVGSFVHEPNLDAAHRLVQAIMPPLVSRWPELKLYLVGDAPPADLQAQASDHVVVTGRVPDLAPFVEQAAIVVAPLRKGGGMRVKVLEALAAGKAVVASTRALEGLDVANGEQALVADDDEAFRAAIACLLEAPHERRALAERARAWACRNLGWQRSVAAYEALYERLLG